MDECLLDTSESIAFTSHAHVTHTETNTNIQTQTQSEGQGVLIQPEHLQLHKEMWARQAKVLQRYSAPAQQLALTQRAAAAANPPAELQVSAVCSFVCVVCSLFYE